MAKNRYYIDEPLELEAEFLHPETGDPLPPTHPVLFRIEVSPMQTDTLQAPEDPEHVLKVTYTPTRTGVHEWSAEDADGNIEFGAFYVHARPFG